MAERVAAEASTVVVERLREALDGGEEAIAAIAADVLDGPPPRAEIAWVVAAEEGSAPLEEWQARRALLFLHDLLGAIESAGHVDDPGAVRAAFAERFAAVATATARYRDSVPASDVASAFWRRLLPRPVFTLGRAVRHPGVTWREWRKARRPPASPAASDGPRHRPVAPPTEHPADPAPGRTNDGVSIVVLAYERPDGLATLLDGLAEQQLGGLDLELICCNNSPRERLARPGDGSELGGRLARFADLKLFDSSHNWKCAVRYAAAALTRYRTVLFLDDDIVLRDPHFVRHAVDSFAALGGDAILSCWTMLWTAWTEDHVEEAPLTFHVADVERPIEVDVAGPGISIFPRHLARDEEVWKIVSHPEADDMAFSLAAWMARGCRSYFLPSHGMLAFHDEWKKGALFFREGHNEALYAQYRRLLAAGYKPVLEREGGAAAAARHAASGLPRKRFAW